MDTKTVPPFYPRLAPSSRLTAVVTVFAALALGARGLAEESAVADREAENLAAFARVLGCVQYFHPGDQAAAMDWNRFGIVGVESVRTAQNGDALRKSLETLFTPIAPGIRILSPHEPDSAVAAVADTTPGRVMYWQHRGVQLGDKPGAYASRRVISGSTEGEHAPLFPDDPPPPQRWREQVAPEVVLDLPLVVPVDENGHTLPPSGQSFSAMQSRLAEPGIDKLTTSDWQLRVGGVIAAWNVFQHFHPYLDQITVDWEQVLHATLRRALADESGADYYATLSAMVAHLGDGHGYVYGGKPPGGGLPIRVDWIEERLVITAVADEAPFRRGDVLVALDGRDATEVLRDRECHVSGSPHLRRLRALNQFGEGPIDSTAVVDVERDGQLLRLEFKRTKEQRGFFFNPITEFPHPAFAEVRPGIFHINLPALSVSELEQHWPELENARGVIFDQRLGVPPAARKREETIQPHAHIIPHLIDEPIQASPMLIPKPNRPDRKDWTFSEGTWPVAPKAPRLKGRIVFINVPSVVSYGETCMAMIANYQLATLVGEPTAGCNGNVNFIQLPQGYRIMWTGMEVLKHDRSPFYGVGFVPDHPVARSIAAVREGKDEYLEEAIAVIEAASK